MKFLPKGVSCHETVLLYKSTNFQFQEQSWLAKQIKTEENIDDKVFKSVPLSALRTCKKNYAKSK